MSKSINPKIQILRAISIIAVVMIHTCPGGLLPAYVRPFINFGVATFLFITGYLTNVENINIKEFYKKRVLRVLIPYTIWSILYTTVNSICFKEPLQYILNYITGGGAPIMYYFFIYIQFVLLTPLLGKLIKSKYWYWGFVVAPISLVFKYYWLLSGTTPNKWISLMWWLCCIGWFTFYYLGLYLKNSDNKRKYNTRLLILMYFLSITLQIIEGYWWYKLGDNNCGTPLKLSALLTSSLFILLAYNFINSNKYNVNSKLLLIIGNNSFGIFLSHCIIITLLSKFINNWYSIPFGVNSFIVFSLALIFTIICRKVFGKNISRYLGLN